ncbi:MAG TPA: hypothetical protein ENJ08_11940 [Gammaproteobacteria bacterium]|nr:hypothetical protein [Gammaproteobacteria bacterium]
MAIDGIGPAGGGAEAAAAIRADKAEKSEALATPAEKATAVVAPRAAPAVQTPDAVTGQPDGNLGNQVDTII